jgi:predicted RNA-binding protein with PIN domain
MPYLIDGYNLLYAIGRLTPRSGRAALDNARKELLRSLGAAAERDGEGVTVVFDAATAPPGKAATRTCGRALSMFAVGQTADDLIEELIARPPSGQRPTVVSDDHRLKEAARRRGCPCLGCLDFYERFLQPRAAAPPKGDAEPEKPTTDDAAHWLKEFGAIDDDPRLGGPF